MRALALLALLAGCGGGMQLALERADAALAKAEPYVLTGCDLTADDTGAECQGLVEAYDELLQATKLAPQCVELPGHLLQSYKRLRSVMPDEE